MTLPDEPMPGPKTPPSWTAREKLQAVVESEGLGGDELGAFLRRKGLHAEQLEAWRKAAQEAVGAPAASRPSRNDGKRIRELEGELRRKEKALAEVSAILVLKKKISALWGEGDEDGSPPKKSGK